MSVRRISGVGLWLVVLWLLLWNDLSVGNVIAGGLVAVVVLASAHLPRLNGDGQSDGQRVRLAPLALLYFLGYVIVKLVQSNLVLAWEIITPRNNINTGIVAVPLRTESELAMLVVANVVTLTPGTVTIEVTGSPSSSPSPCWMVAELLSPWLTSMLMTVRDQAMPPTTKIRWAVVEQPMNHVRLLYSCRTTNLVAPM